MLAKLLRGFAKVWFVLSGILILGSTLMIWKNQGFGRVQELFSPFSYMNYAAILLTISPGIGADVLANKLDARSAQRVSGTPTNEGSLE